MDDLDRRIEEALGAEDRALLERLGEQGLVDQWSGVYRGASGGFARLASVVIVALVAAAAYCGWRFVGATAALDAARWGAGAVVGLGMVAFVKLWFWLRMESNRVLREVKRLELRFACEFGKAPRAS
jgi:hypothetical protein